MDPKRVVTEGYDRLGPAFSDWEAENPKEVRTWFLGEVLARLDEGSSVLELSEIHEEVEARYGLARFQWVIARKPGD